MQQFNFPENNQNINPESSFENKMFTPDPLQILAEESISNREIRKIKHKNIIKLISAILIVGILIVLVSSFMWGFIGLASVKFSDLGLSLSSMLGNISISPRNQTGFRNMIKIFLILVSIICGLYAINRLFDTKGE